MALLDERAERSTARRDEYTLLVGRTQGMFGDQMGRLLSKYFTKSPVLLLPGTQ